MIFDEIEKMEYMNASLQEVPRLYPPRGQIFRVSRRAEVMEGIEIPPNTHVQIPNFLIQRHPLYWPEPETFKPERWINPTNEESGGLCIGQQFATMESGVSGASVSISRGSIAARNRVYVRVTDQHARQTRL